MTAALLSLAILEVGGSGTFFGHIFRSCRLPFFWVSYHDNNTFWTKKIVFFYIFDFLPDRKPKYTKIANKFWNAWCKLHHRHVLFWEIRYVNCINEMEKFCLINIIHLRPKFGSNDGFQVKESSAAGLRMEKENFHDNIAMSYISK